MKSAIFKFTGMVCLTFWSLLCSTHATANTVIYQAITDFPVLDAGEVPYYVDQGRQALAINAALEEYRERFARAEVVYDGQPGVYKITLVALAELDGEAEYHLLVDGDIVGVATNPEVVQDFSVVRHEFPDIVLPAGAVIGVESIANSNGQIPENGEFAFARGRWTMLELSDSNVSADNGTIDLALSASISRQSVQVGEAFDISVTVASGIDSAVATGIVVAMQLPVQSLEMVDGSVCSGTPTGFQCPLPELAAAESTQLTVRLRPTAELSSAPINLTVAADQLDRNQSDNAVDLLLSTSTSEGAGRTEDTSDADSEGAGTDDASINVQTEGAQSETTSSTSSGGGSLSFTALVVFLLGGAYRRHVA